jgi:hypothetical protein
MGQAVLEQRSLVSDSLAVSAFDHACFTAEIWKFWTHNLKEIAKDKKSIVELPIQTLCQQNVCWAN